MVRQIKYSIVIVSWNVKALLLDAIKDYLNRADVEIIVVDNNSADKTVETLKAEYPEVIVIANKDNPGFAGGNNQGFKQAKGAYVFILNPDTVSNYELLTGLGKYLDENPSCGAIGPKIFYGNGTLQKSCARRLPTLGSFLVLDVFRLKKIAIPGIKSLISKWTRYPYDYSKLQSVEAISGAAMLVRRTLLEKLKGFEEIFLHTGEDTNLCYRIAKENYQVIYDPNYTLTHLAGQSSKQDLLKVMVKTNKSSYLFYKGTYGKATANTFWCTLLFIKIPSDILFYAFKSVFLGKNKDLYRLNVGLFKTLIANK